MQALILSVIVALCTVPLSYPLLNLYQQSSYRVRETVRALCRKRIGFYAVYVACLACTPLSVIHHGLTLLTVCACLACAAYYRTVSKVKFKLTARMVRLAAVITVLSAALGTCTLVNERLIALSAMCSPMLLLAAHAITAPIETARNRAYVRRVLADLPDDIIRIGVTGSYGKTTARNILTHFLREKYEVCATQGNYNTPMGVAKSVRSALTPACEVFVAEMGARYKGDIRELCALVKPTHALLTGIGTQHLETFGSVQNIISTKAELIDALPEDGVAVFNADNAQSMQVYHACRVHKLLSGRAGQKANTDASYGDVSISETGSEFTLTICGERVRIITPLVGEHIPSVITQCALLAVQLGVSTAQIKNAATTLKAVAHRQELLYNGSDVIIDDAYNANEQGAISALNTLKAMRRTRVIVTPGIVELGTAQYETNFRVGRHAAECCDFAIFIGANADALKNGAVSGGMNAAHVFTCADLNAATAILKTIKGERAVLFENDLPDNY